MFARLFARVSLGACVMRVYMHACFQVWPSKPVCAVCVSACVLSVCVCMCVRVRAGMRSHQRA